MKYDIIVSEIINVKARTIIAHHIARNLNISLQEAIGKLDNLPVVLFEDVDELTMQNHINKYFYHGVRLKAIKKSITHQKEDSQESNNASTHTCNTSNSSGTISQCYTERIEKKRLAMVKHTADNKRVFQKDRKKSPKLFILFVISLVIGITIILLNRRGLEDNWLAKKNGNYNNNLVLLEKDGVSLEKGKRKESNRKQISNENKKFSILMSDSAGQNYSDINRTINFYKIAISFNRYNLNAWIGLLSVYKQSGMNIEYDKCLNSMKKTFGEQVLSITGTVKKFGNITDSYISDDSVFTISYETELILYDKIQSEAYSLIKDLKSQYGYKSITLSVYYNKSSTMIVHVRPGMKLNTYKEFIKNVSINVFE